MTHAREIEVVDTDHDLVLFDLRQIEVHYHEQQARWMRRIEELERQVRESEYRTLTAQKEMAQLQVDLDAQKRQIEEERAHTQQEREHARELASLLKDIHRALFNGNVYDLILRACLSITGGTRGLYLTVDHRKSKLTIRSAIDVDGYPKASPSKFLREVTNHVLESDQTLVCNSERDLQDFPRPTRSSESFHNLIVAPVVLLKHLSGVVIVGDKATGTFDERDVDALVNIGDQASVAVENNQLRRELQHAYLATVSTLADAMEAKDPYTQGHCEVVSNMSRMIAEQLELGSDEQNVVCYAALLHDTGKIGISDGILNKPGPLLDEERELVRSHVRVGHDLLRHVPGLDRVADVILHHHEWYDGSGYPDGLKGEEIPMAARIVAAVDAYAAMVTQRSYKEAYSEERAREELRHCSGTQFDPKVVECLLRILESPDAWESAHEDEGGCGLLPGFDHERILTPAE